MKHQKIGLGIAFGVAIGTAAPSFGQSLSFGSVVVFNDEWPLTNLGFESAPEGAERFVQNFVGQLDPFEGVRLLVLSSNYAGEWTSTFRQRLSELGASIDTSTDPYFPPTQMIGYDAVILAGRLPSGGPPDNQALIEYVQSGGNVLVVGGTLGSGGDAGLFNTLLNAFGLAFTHSNNNLTGTYPINSEDPFFLGVQGLWQSNGNDIYRVGDHPGARLFALVSSNAGLYAVSGLEFPDCDSDSIPDLVEIRNGAVDADSNGVPDTCEVDPCPGDTNDSGVVNAVDISIILSAWGTDGGKFPRADANNDGTVDASDLSIVLAGWGPCPN